MSQKSERNSICAVGHKTRYNRKRSSVKYWKTVETIGGDGNKIRNGYKLFGTGRNSTVMVAHLWVTLYLNKDIDGA